MTAGGTRWTGFGSGAGDVRLRLLEAKPQGIEERTRHRQVAVPPVGAFDDHPRRLARARAPEHVLGDAAVRIVVLEQLPVALHDPPALAGIGFELREPLLLGVPREVQPELEKQDPFAMEHALELEDLVEGQRRARRG